MCDKIVPVFAREKIKKLQLETTVSRKTIVKKYKKSSRTAKRRNRRKRSKKSYFNMLKKERIVRGTEELCDSIQEFSVIDMDMKPMCDLDVLPPEITEWQKQDQIAYWKSRAISLEIENKMLRQHLRNVYAQQIEYYEKNREWQVVINDTEQDLKSDSSTENRTNKTGKVKENQIPSTSEAPESFKNKKNEVKVSPKEPEGKYRLKEMEKIYGDMAPKIMGMETAIELNYGKLLEEGSPVYWPNIPLKL